MSDARRLEDGSGRNKLCGGEGTDSLDIARDEATVIADLAQVIREMHRELDQELTRLKMVLPNRLGKRLRHLLFAQVREGRFDSRLRFRDLLEDHCAWNVSRGELLVAVPDVAIAAENGTDVMPQVAREVKGKGSGRIRKPGRERPDELLVGIRLQLAAKAAELAQKKVTHHN
ncbi:MAG TPA: hypothetical protein VKM72_11455 [Thermoanaerobaculia bacterium]|nr:hypothetical protein [Thermoanaerobaculia bacterium]